MADTINRSLYANVEGGGKLLTSLYTNIDGSYKQLSAMYSNINGASKQIFPLNISSSTTVTTPGSTVYTWNKYNISQSLSSSSVSARQYSWSLDEHIFDNISYTISNGTIIINSATYRGMLGDVGAIATQGYWISTWSSDVPSSSSYLYRGGGFVYRNEDYINNSKLYVYEVTTYKGSTSYGTVSSSNRNAYPDNNYSGSYWYEYQGTTTTPGSTTTQAVTYSQIKAIQSTGTQHINTGFTANQNTRIIISMEPLSVANVSSGIGHVSYGAGNPSTSSGYENLIWDGQYEFNYGNQTKYATFTAKVGDKLIIDQNKNVVSISINGEQQTLTFNATSFTSSSPLVLFALNRGGDASTYRGISKLYYCKIYNNGTLVRDYVPVSGSNGSVGLYDLVNKKFYGNSGTGTFTAIT